MLLCGSSPWQVLNLMPKTGRISARRQTWSSADLLPMLMSSFPTCGGLQLWTAAVEAMRKAVNATAASALAVNLTAEGLQDLASNQTTELLQVLTRTAAELGKKNAPWLETFDGGQGGRNGEASVEKVDNNGEHSGSRASDHKQSATSSPTSRPKLQDTDMGGNSHSAKIGSFVENATDFNGTGNLESDVIPSEKAQLIIQQVSHNAD